MLPLSPSVAAMNTGSAGAPSVRGSIDRPLEDSHPANLASQRHAPMAQRRASVLAPAQQRVNEVGQRVLEQEPAASGCACMRHWSEVPVWALGALGVTLVAMGVFGGPTVYYVAGGIDLAATIPLFPIVRRYGTIRQQVGMLEDVIERQKQMLEAVQEQLRNLNAEVEQFAENESEISEHVEVLSNGIQNLRDAARMLGERITASRAHRDELSQQTGVQAEQIQQLHQALDQRTTELGALQETVERISRRPETLLRSIDEHSQALRVLGEQIEQVRPALDGERGLLAALEAVSSNQAQADGIQQGLRVIGERLDQFTLTLTQTAERQSQQLARLQEHRVVLEHGIPDLQHDLDDLELRIRQLRLPNGNEDTEDCGATEGSSEADGINAADPGLGSLAD